MFESFERESLLYIHRITYTNKMHKFANPTEMIVIVGLAGTLFRYLTLLRGFHKEAKQQKGSTTRRQPHDFLSAKVFLFKLNCVCYQKL